jgi:hypothetical protein
MLNKGGEQKTKTKQKQKQKQKSLRIIMLPTSS